jgi:CDP-glucose 4,6-dehydratase
MNRLKDFYSGRRVLVTGSTGFKGSWLCLWLSKLNAVVSGYALPPDSSQPLFEELRLTESINQIYGDITEKNAVLSAVQESRPEIVFHLAAQPLVLESYKNPCSTFFINAQGTVELLDALRYVDGIRAIVVITTDKCYFNQGIPIRYRETDPLGGHDPYSASKACVELITASYRDSFFSAKGTGIATARAGNVIGGGDNAPDRIVPDCINKLVCNDVINIRNPEAVRPWQHVLDPLAGYLLLGTKLAEAPAAFSSSWNFGPPERSCVAVIELVKKICRFWGSGDFKIAHDISAPHEESLLALDTTKSFFNLGWQPLIDFDTAVKETVYWYKSVSDGADPAAITAEQIDRLTDMMENR